MGSDRYLYVEVFSGYKGIIDQFVQLIKKENGVIVERSNTEIVSRLLSKNDAIRVGIELIKIGMEKEIDVRSAVGMTLSLIHI